MRQCAAGRPSARSLARGSSCTCSELLARRGLELNDPGFLGGSDARLCPGGRRCSSDVATEEVLRGVARARHRRRAASSSVQRRRRGFPPPSPRGAGRSRSVQPRSKHGPAAATCRASRRPAGWCQSGGGVSSPLVTSIAAASVERAWTSSPQPAADGAPDVIRATKSGNRNSRSTWARAMPPTQVCAPPRLHPNRSPPRSTVVQGEERLVPSGILRSKAEKPTECCKTRH